MDTDDRLLAGISNTLITDPANTLLCDLFVSKVINLLKVMSLHRNVCIYNNNLAVE